jgi:hypothetical protein
MNDGGGHVARVGLGKNPPEHFRCLTPLFPWHSLVMNETASTTTTE